MIYRPYCLQFDAILVAHIRSVETSTIDDMGRLNITLRQG